MVRAESDKLTMSQPEGDSVKDLLNSVLGLLGGIATQQSQFAIEQSRFATELGRLANEVGIVKETSYRLPIILQESSHTRPLVLVSLDSLANYLAESLLERTPTERMAVQRVLCKALLDGDMNSEVLRVIAERIESASDVLRQQDPAVAELHRLLQQHPFIQADGKVDGTSLGMFLGAVTGHPTLYDTLRRLKALSVAKEDDKQMNALLGSDGAGMCLALFASVQAGTTGGVAGKPPPIKKYNDILAGIQHIVEIDVRGCVTVVNGSANIWVGEFKGSRAGHANAVKQLELRLSLMEWAVRTLKPDIKSVMRTGKIFMPAAACAGLSQVERVGDQLIMTEGV